MKACSTPATCSPTFDALYDGPLPEPSEGRIDWTSLAAGFTRVGLRNETWLKSPWIGVNRVRPPLPVRSDRSDASEVSMMFAASIERAIGNSSVVGVTVSGGADSAAVLAAAASACRRDGRRLVAVTLDIVCDDGYSSWRRAQQLVKLLAPSANHVRVKPDASRWPMPAWSIHGPRFDAWPRLRFGLTAEAEAAGVEVLLHGTGADELISVPPYLSPNIARRFGVAALPRYLRCLRALGWSDFGELAGLTARMERTAELHWYLTWPQLARDPVPGPLTRAALDCARHSAAERAREVKAYVANNRPNWADAAAITALQPRDLSPPAGRVREVAPFLDRRFAEYVLGIPLVDRFDPSAPNEYAASKRLVWRLLPDDAVRLLPRERVSAYAAYERYWAQEFQLAPNLIQLGIIRPTWSAECRDAFERAIILSTETWLAEALLQGAEIPS